MDEAHERADWERASLVAAMIANANPFRSGKPITPNDLNPFSPKTPTKNEPLKIGFDAFLALYGKPPKPPKQ